jgi:hypothetical protein
MASVTITPIAAAIKVRADTITGLTTYASDPGLAGLEGNPALVIGLPDIDRGELEGDDQLGSRTWVLNYPVNIYVDLDEPASAFTLARDTVESFINAVDADDQLGASVVAARVTEASPALDISETHCPRLLYECNVQVKAYV